MHGTVEVQYDIVTGGDTEAIDASGLLSIWYDLLAFSTFLLLIIGNILLEIVYT